MYWRETAVAGKTIFEQRKACTRVGGKNRKRKAKQEVTAEAVQKVNDRNAERNLAMKLNANFKPSDYHLVLTYAGDVPTPEDAKKALNKFLRNLNLYAKRQGKEFKYVAVTEYEHKRIHHHVVITKLEVEQIQKRWQCGFVRFVPMEESGNFVNLATYLLKETAKTFREADNPCKRRYTCSRNIVTPEIKRQLITSRELHDEPKPPKGYYTDKDSVRHYEHAILGVECWECIHVSLEEEPRLKRWSRGQKVKPEKYYKITEYEEQLRIEGTYDS